MKLSWYKGVENGIIVTSNEKHVKSKIQAEKAKQKRKYKELFININFE